MSQINLANFLKISQKGIQSPNTNGDVVNLLLGSLIDRENILDRNNNLVDITPSKISGWFNQTKDVEQAIRDKVSADRTILERCKAWFDETFIPTLNIHLVSDFYSEMKNLMENDTEISIEKQSSIIEKLDNKDYPGFLAESFLYCLSKSNLRSNEPIPTSDYYLLAECGSSCPICGKQLTENIRNTSIKKYEVIQYDFLDSSNDKLCLCRDCADIYDGELFEDEAQLILSTKAILVRDAQLKTLSNSAKLEKDILEVINNLSSIDPSTITINLPLDAVNLKSKIHSSNPMLAYDINEKVTSFYNTVRNIFSNLEGDGIINFEIIASQVRLYYLRLEQESLEQSQIYERVTQWIFESSGNNSNKIACQIIAAFFVQNCEVFHEISQ